MSEREDLKDEIIAELKEVKGKIPWWMGAVKALALVAALAGLVAAFGATFATAGLAVASAIAAIASVIGVLWWILDQVSDDGVERGKLERKEEELRKMTTAPSSD